MTYAVISVAAGEHAGEILAVVDPEEVFVEDSYPGFKVDFVDRIDDQQVLFRLVNGMPW